MPTGYTAPVEDGEITELSDFAKRCARAFGVAVEQRDEPLENAVRPLNIEDDSTLRYYNERLAEARSEIAWLVSLNTTERNAEFEAYKARLSEQEKKAAESSRVKTERYTSMLDKVKAWKIDTDIEFLVNLKKFMIDQLTESIRYVAHEPGYYRPGCEDAASYIKEQIESKTDNINYYLASVEDRKRSIREQNEALAALALWT